MSNIYPILTKHFSVVCVQKWYDWAWIFGQFENVHRKESHRFNATLSRLLTAEKEVCSTMFYRPVTSQFIVLIVRILSYLISTNNWTLRLKKWFWSGKINIQGQNRFSTVWITCINAWLKSQALIFFQADPLFGRRWKGSFYSEGV